MHLCYISYMWFWHPVQGSSIVRVELMNHNRIIDTRLFWHLFKLILFESFFDIEVFMQVRCKDPCLLFYIPLHAALGYHKESPVYSIFFSPFDSPSHGITESRRLSFDCATSDLFWYINICWIRCLGSGLLRLGGGWIMTRPVAESSPSLYEEVHVLALQRL